MCSGDSRGKPDWHRVCTGTDWLWRRVSQLAAIRRLPCTAESDSLTAAICTSTSSAFGRNAPSQSEPSAAGTASLGSARACDQAEISIRKSGVPAGFLLRCRASFLFCTQAKSFACAMMLRLLCCCCLAHQKQGKAEDDIFTLRSLTESAYHSSPRGLYARRSTAVRNSIKTGVSHHSELPETYQKFAPGTGKRSASAVRREVPR
ncbi:hypothetical protein L1887_52171 [Cichorium endivia]|nr:hypothetical protein L1887_52171 [Cichorium endivia]